MIIDVGKIIFVAIFLVIIVVAFFVRDGSTKDDFGFLVVVGVSVYSIYTYDDDE